MTLTGTVWGGQFGRELVLGRLEDDPILDVLVVSHQSGFWGFTGGPWLTGGLATGAPYSLTGFRGTSGAIGR